MQFGAEFAARVESLLTPAADVPAELHDAVLYAITGPGKRLRPYLLVRACELVGGSRATAWPAAVAVECIHAFSLIHDDLPCMDDDDLRRGRPTVHRKFGEAIAVLAGDALAVLPFELLAAANIPAHVTAAVSLELARATGWVGMIGGQAADVLGEGRPPSEITARYIHLRKTARLFEAACRMGALVGTAGPDQLARLASYGCNLGQAFQIADDLLDVAGSAESTGKAVGKDASHGKQTIPRCVGIEASRRIALELIDAAVAALASFGSEADDLRAIARFVIDRNY